jgi:L-rhamnose mutarotase
MPRVALLLKVRPDKLEEYKEHHTRVWPELLEAHRRAGWYNYSLFMRKDGLVFGYFETPHSYRAAVEAIEQEEINARWDEFMAPYLEAVNEATGEIMLELDQVFHLD